MLAMSAALLGLGGCAVVPPGPDQSPTGTSTPQPTEVEADPIGDLAVTGAKPELLDRGLVAGIMQSEQSKSTYQPHLFASWPHFGMAEPDRVINDYFSSALASFEADHPTTDPAEGSSEYNLNWYLIGASTQAVGVLANGYLSANGTSLAEWHSMWFNPTTQAVITNAALVKTDLIEAALSRAATTARTEVTLGTAAFAKASVVAFSEAGDLLVGFDQCQIAACSAGRVSLTIPASEATTVLSDLGTAAQTASIQPVPVLPVASPSPSGSQDSTASTTATKPGKNDGKRVNCAKAKCIALTFDDGPGPYTEKLASYLKSKNVKSTFFMLGQQVQAFPEAARKVAAAGHEIGVHTWDHRSLPLLTNAQIKKEISSTVKIIRSKAGVTPTVMRPPYGAVSTRVLKTVKKSGLAVILWNVDTLDWKTKSTPKTVKAALRDAKRGSIVLMHDIHGTTVDAVPKIVEGLQKKGYTLVTVSELLGKTKPGKKYFSA